jgi:hypothetical protein
MDNFETWYALEGEFGYRCLYKQRKQLESILTEETVPLIVELAVVFSDEPTGYVADGNLNSVLTSQLAKHLYEDLTSFRAVKLTPIVRCPRCQIASVDGVFHFSYKNRAATPEKVLATVCIPTDGFGDNQDKPCLALYRHGGEIGYAKKSKEELSEFVQNNAVVKDLDVVNDYHLKMAKEFIDGL